MFDKFEPMQQIKKINFTFQPVRYETWISGKMISSGRTTSLIDAKVIFEDDVEKTRITFVDPKLNHELSTQNIFDEFVSQHDRLQLITIPENTNVEIVAFMLFRSTIGSTRKHKEFARSEPYCCNIFLFSGTIVKITFSYNNPEKLLEFYNQ